MRANTKTKTETKARPKRPLGRPRKETRPANMQPAKTEISAPKRPLSPAAYQIEEGVPLPTTKEVKAAPQGRNRIYPLAEMKPGSSFGVPVSGEDRARAKSRISTALTHFMKKNPGTKFVSKTNAKRTEVRVWRVE